MRYIELTEKHADEIVAMWNRNVSPSFPLSKQLFIQNTINDSNLVKEATSVVELEGKVIGFVVTKCLQDDLGVQMNKKHGWIQALLVDEVYRRQGIGKQLLHLAEHALIRRGIEVIQLGGDINHYLCGIPLNDQATLQFAKKQDYDELVVTHDLYRFLDEEIELPSLQDVTFKPLKIEEKDAFIGFLHRCFPGRWEYEAIRYFNHGGQGDEFVVIKNELQQIIGFSRMNKWTSPVIAQNVNWAPGFKGPLGGVGPLGVDEQYRGKGYGLAVTQAAIHFLQRRGCKEIIIDWTVLVDFYRLLKFDIWQSYTILTKKVT